MNVGSHIVDISPKLQLMENHLILTLIMMKSRWKSLNDSNLNPAKLSTINPTEDNFTEPLSIKKILDELEISIF